MTTRLQSRVLKESKQRTYERDDHYSLSYFSPTDGQDIGKSYKLHLTEAITMRSITNEEKKASFSLEHKIWIEKDAYKEVLRSQVPIEANIIGFCITYGRKTSGLIKDRIFP
eukprot:IDg9481t1